MGLASILVSERLGGAGFGWIELGIALQETGRALTNAPLLGTSLALAALVDFPGSDEGMAQLIRKLVDGSISGAFARATPESAQLSTDRGRVTGVVDLVVDGHDAGVLLLASGDQVFLCAAAGWEAEAIDVLDASRPLARIELRDAPVVALDDVPAGWLEALAALGIALESVGAAERCVEVAVAYAKERIQFARPIGSFQAIQHLLVEVYGAVTSARAIAEWASWVASCQTPATFDEQLVLAVRQAKAAACDAFSRAAKASIQVHGGVGFTMEHEAHRYYRRAASARQLFGTPAEHRAKLAEAMLR